MEEAIKPKGGKVVELVKALVLSIIVTLALVLVAAFVVKAFNVPTDYIPIINRVIKSAAILTGALAFLREKGGGFIRGTILGLSYAVVTFFLFSAMNGSLEFTVSALNDLAAACVCGFISGIIAVNLRK